MAQTSGSVALRAGQRERELDSLAVSRGAQSYALLLFGASLGWVFIVREVQVSRGALLSFVVQQAVVWGVYYVIDRRLERPSSIFAWAAASSLYATCIALDAFLMRMTSLPLVEILPMLLASRHVLEGMREIGLSPWRLLVLFAALLGSMAAGGGLRLFLGRQLPRTRRPRFATRIWTAGLLALAGLFALEQTLSRDAPDYLFRGTRMPTYVQLFSESSHSVVVALAEPVEHAARARWLDTIGPAKNPRHVLYVLLESFRYDVVNPLVTPTIWQLAQQGQWYGRALAEATYTPLSWSVLLFDEHAHDNLFGRHSGRPEPLGSWLLAVMRRAGYRSHVSVSTNLTYARTRERLLGNATDHLDFFQAAADVGDDPSNKNGNDQVATDHLVQFIEQHGWDDSPQFLLLQLDSTHYTYPFPAQEAVFKPFSAPLTMPRAIETAQEASLLRNRYYNAAHFVDRQLGRVIAALKRKGIYDDMAIVLTADHGEGLSPGLQGHASVYEATKRVPLVLRFPGEVPGRSQQLISHRDILPSLTDYLGIAMGEGSLRGHAAASGASPGVFTLAPSGRFGQLTTADYVVDLSLVFKARSVIVTPTASKAGRDLPVRQWLPILESFIRDEPPPHSFATR